MFFQNGQGFLASSPAGAVAPGATITSPTLVGPTLSGTMTGASGSRILMPDGTAALPPYGWSSDTDTGHYFESGEIKVGHTAAEVIGVGASSVASTSGKTLTWAGNAVFNSAFRLARETIKTTGYTITATDAIIISNGVSLTHNLPASPGTSQVLFLYNQAATDATIARNGSGNINGAAADYTLPATTAVVMQYSGTEWQVIG